ncbi:MAG: enoyl-CoA hydratase/isomerase family protein [Candidatus Sericytochromatia bacterium]
MSFDPDTAASPALKVIDLAAPHADLDVPAAPTVAVGSADDFAPELAQRWLQRATFTLTDDEVDDRRVVTVPSVHDAVAEISERVQKWPQAAGVCDDVLRVTDPAAPAWNGLVTESLAYSTLQSGSEFRDWLARRGPASVPSHAEPVLVEREGDSLTIWLNRPDRHNAFSTDMRQALLDALMIARVDPSIHGVTLASSGPSFCSGGDLAEFGSFDDPVTAHFARTRHSPAYALDELAARLGEHLKARVHGQVLGSGLEMAAFCGRVEADRHSRFGLPELALGLIPGAGGTVSITRRMGRWRTAYLVLSGRTITAETALAWGLVDAVTE